MESQDPRQLLAQRLRALREDRWPGKKITQPQLAQALGGSKPLSGPHLVLGIANQPAHPSARQAGSLGGLFASPGSFDANKPRLLSSQDMTDEERQAMACSSRNWRICATRR